MKPMRKLLLILPFLLLLSPLSAHAQPETLSTDSLEKGMKGYGVTVFEGTEPETFPVEVLGVLNNVMPDQDIILIKAHTELLNHTMIMAGMSGSPIYINEKLIGALAYSWSFEKEPIAGVTPIRNILEADQRGSLEPGHGNLKKIQTPLVATGFQKSVRNKIGENLSEFGLRPQFTAGGQAGSGAGQIKEDGALFPGSALGVQLMRGDLSLTAVGTVTHVGEDGTVYAFGHPFMGNGQITFPMTSATVHTYMPSYQSSFKLASPGQTVGTITEDRQAAIVGQLGIEPSMLPVKMRLRSPDQQFEEEYQVEVIRDRNLTPGLINSAVSNFASKKLEENGTNWLETTITAKQTNNEDLRIDHTDLVRGSYDPWSLLPLLELWSNPFQEFQPEQITIDMTLHHGRQSARIEDFWINGRVRPGESLSVFTRIQPYRGKPITKKQTIEIPESLEGDAIRMSAVPATRLSELESQPDNFKQLLDSLNRSRSPRTLAIVLEWTDPALKESGHTMEKMPLSVLGKLGMEQSIPTAGIQSSTRINRTNTNWILQGSLSQILPITR